MNIKTWINGHPMFLITLFTQVMGIIGLVCGFAALFMNTLSGEHKWAWVLCFDLPLLLFVFWAWFKAIIPLTLKIIDDEEKRYKENGENI